MDNKDYVEVLKKEILRIENDKIKTEQEGNPKGHIAIAHINSDLFLKMAYLFVGIHG